MTAPIDELLARTTDDLDLCSEVFNLIVRHHGGDFDAAALTVEQQTVLLAYHAKGIIDNGGFNYLFEGDFPGDPHFELTARAYGTLGCQQAAEAFRQVFALFPEGKPPRDRGKRLQQYRAGPGERRGGCDDLFWKGSKDLFATLADYIRAHRAAFTDLIDRPLAPPQERDDEEPLPEPEDLPLEMLPHWARVAFAARCARHVWPLFEQHWPTATDGRKRTVLQAIELAELSAEEAQPADGLEQAALDALMTAGAALSVIYGIDREDNEPMPPDGNAASSAAAVAKAAEFAARAAQAGVKESVQPAGESAAFALQAAEEDEELGERIRHDLARLQVAALRERWKDRTPVSAALIESLPAHDPPQTSGVLIIDIVFCMLMALAMIALAPHMSSALASLAGLLAIYSVVVGILIGMRHRMAPPTYFAMNVGYIAIGLGLLSSLGFSLGRLSLVLGPLCVLYFNYPDVRAAIQDELEPEEH
ncbi:MAG: DUF4375 domain-containing protein [Gemmataceae bacterium]